MTIFKACDIRGMVGRELDEAVMLRIGRSLGQVLRGAQQSAICVGGDFRRSTPALKHALSAGLLELGIHVCDVGQVPTPVVYFAGRFLRCPNVAVITASHNPGRYNGLKFMVAGRPAADGLVPQVEAGLTATPPTTGRGQSQVRDILPDYERETLRQAQDLAARIPAGQQGAGTVATEDSATRRPRPLHIVLDAMAGAATELAPRVLQAAGHRVTPLGDRIDPDFSARAPDPSQDANLQPLAKRVLAERADLGIALDGDGDRVILVTGEGQIVRPEQLGALLATSCFTAPTVVYDLKCASVLARIVTAAGGTPVMSPSGHGFIRRLMLERQAELGVEVSGHHFFGALDGGDDGLLTALVACHLLARTGSSLQELTASIAWPAITPDLRIAFHGDAAATIDLIARSCGGRVGRLDGVRADYEDAWALVRASITEAALTLRFEGRNWNHVRETVQRFLHAVPELQDQTLRLIREYCEHLTTETSDE